MGMRKIEHDIRMKKNPQTFFKYFVLTSFSLFFLSTLTENSLNLNGTYMGQKQPFESFLKNVCSEQLVFWGLMRLCQFEYYLQQIFIIILAVVTRGSFRGRVSESLFMKQNRPTLNKHGTSFPLKLFKQQNDESRYIFRTRSNNWWSSLQKSLQISVVDCFKKSLAQMFGRFLNASFKSL